MRCGDWFSNTVDPLLRLETCGRNISWPLGKYIVVDRSKGGTHDLKYAICIDCEAETYKSTYLPWPDENRNG